MGIKTLDGKVISSADTDNAIIENHLAGDTSAFSKLVERHERFIYNLAFRMAGNADDAADLTQEIFIHLHRKISGFRAESAFTTWFYRLAINYSKDWLSKETKRVKGVDIDEVVLLDGASGPGQVLEQKEVQQLVQATILELPEDQRAAVILHDIQGYNYAEIADILGVPVGTVKSRLARARLKLAEKLAPYGNNLKE
jgi:RNA polymerase sigma-70 factor (ECF subfamily)